jgi:hypothetical protein
MSCEKAMRMVTERAEQARVMTMMAKTLRAILLLASTQGEMGGISSFLLLDT